MSLDNNQKASDGWQARAVCRDLPHLDFFPEQSKSRAVPMRIREACTSCPVQDACLDLALSFPEIEDQDGIFGGLNPSQRGEIRKHYSRTHNGALIENREI